MIYKPSPSPQPPLTFHPRPRNIPLPLDRKKSHSIKPLLHFSPPKTADNPQDKRKELPVEQRKWIGRALNPSATVKQPTESVVNLRDNQKNKTMVSHNLSVNNLRTTFSPVPFARRDRQMQKRSKEKGQADSKGDGFFEARRKAKNSNKKEEKKCKEAPSFIRNKIAHNSPAIDDFKVVRSLRETEQYKEVIALHNKTQALFVVKAYKKAALSKEKELCEEIKFYIKNLEICHNLIVKCFGFFSDADSLYLVEEFLAGETMAEYMTQRTQPLNEQEIGSKVCEILTALTYLNSLQFSYGNLTQANVIHSLNVCKLKRPYLIHQGKDVLFDIWCLGKLVFEMVTLCCLVEEHLLEGIHHIEQLFSSGQIVMALELGFKQFEGSSLSRDLIAFLVATLWEIQNEQLTLQQVWDMDFVKFYKEEDIWQTHPQK